MKFVNVSIVLFFSFLVCSCGSDPVDLVKNGILDFDKSVTVGNAIDGYKYFENVTWNTFKTDQGRVVVQVEGHIIFPDTNVARKVIYKEKTFTCNLKEETIDPKYVIQFVLLQGEERFKIAHEEINYKCSSGKSFRHGDLGNFLSMIYSQRIIMEDSACCSLFLEEKEKEYDMEKEKEKKEHDMAKEKASGVRELGKALDGYKYFNKVDWRQKNGGVEVVGEIKKPKTGYVKNIQLRKCDLKKAIKHQQYVLVVPNTSIENVKDGFIADFKDAKGFLEYECAYGDDKQTKTIDDLGFGVLSDIFKQENISVYTDTCCKPLFEYEDNNSVN